MSISTVELSTSDGVSRTQVFTPDAGAGPWPGAVFCIDGAGPRPSLSEMAHRLANEGYVVALPDLFHRAGEIADLLPPHVPGQPQSFFSLMGNPEFRSRWHQRFFLSATNEAHLRADVGAALDYLSEHKSVRPGGMGVTGYCMGGNCSFRAAALFPDRIAAAASFHGGFLATSAPDSPHLGAARIKARLYFAGAIEDPSFTDAIKSLLVESLTKAGVTHVVETYNARHGFSVPDSPAYNRDAAERHHAALTQLFKETLVA